MRSSVKRVLLCVIVLILVSMACVTQERKAEIEALLEADEATQSQDESSSVAAEPQVPTPKPTVVATQPRQDLGGCYWHNYEIVNPPDSTSDPKMKIFVNVDTPSSTQNNISTTISHGISGCPEQTFFTYHDWQFNPVLKPGETEKFWIRLEWSNNGTVDCSALVAGAITSLSSDALQLKAQAASINVKTDPEGSLEDMTTWLVPEGAVGDQFTITVHASTGSYGGNTRYRYEFICD